MADLLRFTVPGKPEYVGVVRLAVSSAANTAGFDVEDIEDKGDDQFEIADGRSVDEIYQALLEHHLQPVMSDYIYV